MSDGAFHLFSYGSLREGPAAARYLPGCERVGRGTVGGILYDIDGQYTALVRYGRTPVSGVIWRCPFHLLPGLDEYEGVASGLFRRVGVEVDAESGGRVPCWIYVAGPRLTRKLIPSRRVEAGAS